VDPGIDDSLAILLALHSPELSIEGITVVSGNVEVKQATINALKAVEMAGKEVSVYQGMALPLVRQYHDATDTHGKDGLGETFFPPPAQKPEDEHAVDFILRKVKELPNQITLLALGPLTNIAKAIQEDPEAMQKVKRIVLMGGSARYHGNCSPVAEYNFWVDPHAAKIVFASGIEITMVGLDVTHQIVFTPHLREVVHQLGTPLSQYIYDITQFYVDFHWKQEKTIGCVINDPLAVAILVKPELVTTQRAYVDIETEGVAIGQSVADFAEWRYQEKWNTHVCVDVNPKAFFELFLYRLFPEHRDQLQIGIEKHHW
jgi:purine nucleosidase